MFTLIFALAPTLLLPIHCVFILLFRKWLGSFGTFYSSIYIFITLVGLVAYSLQSQLIGGKYYYSDWGVWFSCLHLVDSHFCLCSDLLSNTCALLVLFLTPIALYFGLEYMVREAFANRLLYLLNLFATSVVFLFYAYDFFLILLFWECVGLFSLLLVNFYSTRIYTIKAALKTFVFSRISDMFLFIGFLLSINAFNTCELSLIFLQIPFFSVHYLFIGSMGIHFLSLLAACIAIGGVIKCAQIFFHVWLPDAMEAPTPASALIHSSTLVVAGVYLIIRFSLLFEFAYYVNLALALLGATTLAFSAVTAVFQQDIKKLVAYSTISQIGYLICGCGFGCYDETLIYLVIHALNKAFLFILVGYLVHNFNGNTDLRFMGNSHVFSFDIAVIMLVLAANLSGLPYFAGFASKEFLVTQFFLSNWENLYIRACWQVAFLFTPVYMFMLIFNVFYGPSRSRQDLWRVLTQASQRTCQHTYDVKTVYTSFSASWVASLTSSILYSILLLLILSIGELMLITLTEYASINALSNQNQWLTHTSHFFLTVSANTLVTLTFLTSTIVVSFYGVYCYMHTFFNSSQLLPKPENAYVEFAILSTVATLLSSFSIHWVLLSYGLCLVTRFFTQKLTNISE